MISYSIIIPHYNIPDLLMRCLRSIPVREDIQVIVVDDCSPDASRYLEDYPELSRPYLEFYSTLRGGSAGRARNIGLEHAKGKWLVFADADDLFVDDIEQILDCYLESSSDVVYFDHKVVDCTDLSKVLESNSYEQLFRTYERTGNEGVFRCDYPSPWGKMIRNDLVKRIQARFDETHWSNDFYFSVFTGIKAKSIEVSSQQIYIYTEREGSLSKELCSTIEEWRVRYGVSKRVYKLVSESPYRGQTCHFFYYLDILKNKSQFLFLIEIMKLFSEPFLLGSVLSNMFVRKYKYLLNRA